MPDIHQDLMYFYEDFSAEDLDESLVGRKGLSLFRLKDIDVPVPDFFVISSNVYVDFIAKTFGNQIDLYLKEKKLPDPFDIAKMIDNCDFDIDIQEELLKNYTKLSGFSDAWISVRSSVV